MLRGRPDTVQRMHRSGGVQQDRRVAGCQALASRMDIIICEIVYVPVKKEIRLILIFSDDFRATLMYVRIEEAERSLGQAPRSTARQSKAATTA